MYSFIALLLMFFFSFFQLSIYLKLRQESQLEVASQSNTLWVFSFYKLKELYIAFDFFPPLYTQALKGLALSIMCTDAIIFWVHSFKVPCRSSLVNRYSKKIISKPCYSLPLATSYKLFELFIFFVYWINLLPWCLLIPAGSNGDFSKPVWSD